MRHLIYKLLVWLLLPGTVLAAEQAVVDIHFAVLTQRTAALRQATEAQMRREVDILNTYFKGADGSKPVLFRFKDVVFANQLPATTCAPLVELGDLNQEYDYTTLMTRFRACTDSRLVDPKAVNVFVYDSYNLAYGDNDITCHGIHNSGRPLVLLDWERLNHTTQSPEEHEFGHVFGLGHVCVPGATLNTSTNIMASADCGLGSGGLRNIGFDTAQLSTISRYAKTVVATLGFTGQAAFTGRRSSYHISKTATGFTVTDGVGVSTSLTSATSIKFEDVTVNLLIGDLSKTIDPADLKTLIELYVAFFNRVPEADGLAYWITRFKAGMTLDQMADSFYAAAIDYASSTGYWAGMSDAEFVGKIYTNVLGRTGINAPPDADVQYWVAEFTSGRLASKGQLVSAMLWSAHTFSNDPTWSWVPQLLDYKVQAATLFALAQGLNYNTPEESISIGMAIGAAVTKDGIDAAVALMNLTDATFNLTLP